MIKQKKLPIFLFVGFCWPVLSSPMFYDSMPDRGRHAPKLSEFEIYIYCIYIYVVYGKHSHGI